MTSDCRRVARLAFVGAGVGDAERIASNWSRASWLTLQRGFAEPILRDTFTARSSPLRIQPATVATVTAYRSATSWTVNVCRAGDPRRVSAGGIGRLPTLGAAVGLLVDAAGEPEQLAQVLCAIHTLGDEFPDGVGVRNARDGIGRSGGG